MKPLYLLLLSLALLLFAGCGKMPENGDLDGLWQLVEMHSKADPTDPQYSHYTDKRAEKVRWAFQLQLLSMKSFDLLPGTDTNEAVARFQYSSDRLQLTQIYLHYRDRDQLVEDPATAPFQTLGVRGCKAQFRIAKLGGSRLILCSDMDSLVFVKK